MASRTGIVATVGIIAMFVFSTSVMGFAEDEIAMMNALRGACLAATGADETMVMNTAKGDFPDDLKLKQYMECIYEQIGVLVDNVIDCEALIDLIKALMPEEIAKAAEETVKACSSESTAAEGNAWDKSWDAVYNFQKCMYSMNPTYYVAI